MQKKKRTSFVILSLICCIYAHSFERNMCTYLARLLKQNKSTFQKLYKDKPSISNVLPYAHRKRPQVSYRANQRATNYSYKETIINIFNRLITSYRQQQAAFLQAHKKYTQQLKNESSLNSKKPIPTAVVLGTGILAIGKQKSRVVYAEEISKSTFELKKSYFTNPKSLRKKLSQYNKKAHPELSKQIIISINGYLSWKWQWALKKAIKQAPKSVNILIEFLAPHIMHLAEHSQECAGVIAFVHQENPNMLKPIKAAILENKENIEQATYGKEILKAIKL